MGADPTKRLDKGQSDTSVWAGKVCLQGPEGWYQCWGICGSVPALTSIEQHHASNKKKKGGKKKEKEMLFRGKSIKKESLLLLK